MRRQLIRALQGFFTFAVSLSSSGRALFVLACGMLLAAFAVSLHALGSPIGFFACASLGLTVCGASLLASGTVGFLFGIPRSQLAIEKVTETRRQADVDADAISVATRQVNSSPNAERVDEEALREVIQKASASQKKCGRRGKSPRQ